jgi:hypothetical protein
MRIFFKIIILLILIVAGAWLLYFILGRIKDAEALLGEIETS